MTLADTAAALGARALRTRALARAPIALYRAGLGFLFGRRLLMMEHIGRSSGAKRYVVLEVVDHPAPTDYVVASGFGVRAQWYRNIEARPEVRVWTGLRRAVPGRAESMNAADSAAALEQYRRAHPAAWANLRAVIERATGAPVDTLPMVRLRLR
ncbi:nitroreductase family deazaflavin-dependent oxidoreductase [Nocardia veterana]|uniref:Nitroreductase family deazaflavin-dependent oxidoreductase n=1 Tax=Nocardia veterana TaxID=132249 RepID=A0A7X6RKG8_9NOCA|nr:nitroreductase family deazaflavin-dependent oxidoreductase [Nocardia veterana]NKY89317.1 nitroreductase family deazaflavin-dependent oxidoreductase [Nocardia veterana]